ncbi:MAG: hypothetical protein ACREM8_03840 [Vulcanimicrobiaceae bacterium]
MISFVTTDGVLAQNDPTAFPLDVEAACGHHFYRSISAGGRAIDGAATAGDNSRVVVLGRQQIETAVGCLDNLRPGTPSAVPVYLRWVILGTLNLMMLADANTDAEGIQAEQDGANAAKIATKLCREPDLLSQQQPYVGARAAVIASVDFAAGIYAYSSTPLDQYKDDYRACAARLGVLVSF